MLEEYSFFTRNGVKAYVVTFGVNRKALYNYDVRRLVMLGDKHSFLSNVLTLRSALRRLRPDVVIGPGGSATELYLATIFSPIQLLIHMHGTFFWNHGDPSLKYATLHRRVFKQIMTSVKGHTEFAIAGSRMGLWSRMRIEIAAVLDFLAVRSARMVTVNSPQMQWEVARIYGHRSVVLHGAISSDLLNYRAKEDIRQKLALTNKRVLLSVSVLNRNKRIDLLIKAFHLLDKQIKDLVLLIVGDGPDLLRLQTIVKDLNLGDRIIFAGFVDDKILWDYYFACDVFLSAAWADFDLALYEALAMQKNIVCSSETSGRLVEDARVTLVDPSVECFAEGIRKALESNVPTRSDVSEYTWENCFRSIFSGPDKNEKTRD